MGEAGMVRLRLKEEQESRGAGDRRRGNFQAVLDLPLKSAFLLISFSPALLLDSPAANSNLAVVEAVDQAGEHAGDFLQPSFEFPVRCLQQQPTSQGQFQQRHAFLDRTAGDAEEVLPVGFGEPAVAFRNVRGNRQRRPVELVDQKAVTARELLSLLTDRIREIDRL
jgi:hypothetical protein